MRYLFLAFAALIVAGGAWALLGGSRDGGKAGRAAAAIPGAGPVAEMVAVRLPVLAADALTGQKVFAARCAACHGANAGGIDGAGPPLIHAYYRPGHHGDPAFVLAAQNGVRSHHWRFGDMPPVEDVTRAEIDAAIAFVRAVQRENGIF